jgi:hypothetical protein
LRLQSGNDLTRRYCVTDIGITLNQSAIDRASEIGSVLRCNLTGEGDGFAGSHVLNDKSPYRTDLGLGFRSL